MNILYENKNVLVCVKPVGLLSEGGDGESVVSLVSEYLSSKGKDYASPLHRLDRNVGGVMAFAADKKAAGQLSAALADKEQCIKEYLAVVSGVPEKAEGIFEDFLFKDSAAGKVFVVKSERRGARRASLSYRVLGNAEGKKGMLSLVLIRLQTGRTHQIRVQFSSRGMPVVGDGKYGSREKCSGGIALFSHRLALNLPGIASFDVSALPDGSSYPFSLFDLPQGESKCGKTPSNAS